MEENINAAAEGSGDSGAAASRPEAAPSAACSSCSNTKTSGTSRKTGCWTIFGIAAAAAVFCIFCVMFLCFIVFAAVLYDESSAPEDRAASSRFSQYIVDKSPDAGKEKSGRGTKNAKDGVIYMLPIHGAIVSSSGSESVPGTVSDEYVSRALEFISSQENVKALIVDISSPGGSVTPSDNIYHEIKLFKEKNNIPVIAMFEDMACSGGYYAAMASDRIVALPTCWTGSIGVIMQLPEFASLMGKAGVNVNTITSLNYKGEKSFKDIGSSYRAMRPEERALLQKLVTDSYNRFTSIVAEGRKGKLDLNQVRKLADGRIYNSQQALKNKLIDEIGYRQDLYKTARQMGQAPRADIIGLEAKGSIFSSLSGSAADFLRSAALARLLSQPEFKGTGAVSAIPGETYRGSLPRPMYMVPGNPDMR